MAYECVTENIPGITAAGDLSAHQYKFVTLASGQAALNTVAAGLVDGILQDDPAAPDRACSVAVAGVSKLVAGAPVTVGALVASDGAGLGVPAITGDFFRGRALTEASASGELITVSLAVFGVAP